jgi:hypothetical protein
MKTHAQITNLVIFGVAPFFKLFFELFPAWRDEFDARNKFTEEDKHWPKPHRYPVLICFWQESIYGPGFAVEFSLS